MISWKSKLKVLYKSIIVEFILVATLVYLSTIQQPWVLQSIEEHFAESILLVMCFELAIIFFSFSYEEKHGVFHQATFTMEQIFQIVFTDLYNRAVALDVLSKRAKNKEKDNGI